MLPSGYGQLAIPYWLFPMVAPPHGPHAGGLDASQHHSRWIAAVAKASTCNHSLILLIMAG